MWKVDTTEGRKVNNYWKFRIGGYTVEQYLETACNHPSYVNKKNAVEKELLSKYFSMDKVFSDAFGSPTTSTACVLTDPRMDASFNQLNIKNRSKVFNSLLQTVSAGGAELGRAAFSYVLKGLLYENLILLPGI